MPNTAAKLNLEIRAAAGTAHVPFLRRHIRQAHRLIRPAVRELSLALVGDRAMADLHRRFLGVSGPTDVISFPLDTDRRGRPVDGEVIICVPQAVRSARQRNIPIRNELLLYCLHGMLHLCGYDDTCDGEYHRMHEMEDRILRELGVGEVFGLTPHRNKCRPRVR